MTKKSRLFSQNVSQNTEHSYSYF